MRNKITICCPKCKNVCGEGMFVLAKVRAELIGEIFQLTALDNDLPTEPRTTGMLLLRHPDATFSLEVVEGGFVDELALLDPFVSGRTGSPLLVPVSGLCEG